MVVGEKGGGWQWQNGVRKRRVYLFTISMRQTRLGVRCIKTMARETWWQRRMMVEGGGKPPNKLSGIDPFLYQLKTENMIKRGLRD